MSILFQLKSSNDPFSLTNNNDLLPELINWMCKDLQNRIGEVLPYLPKHVIDDMIYASNFCLSQGDKYDTEKARIIMSVLSVTEGLSWTGNSCYMDSALQCLLAVPSQLNEYILNVNLKENVITDNNICGNTEEQDLEVRKEIQDELGLLTDTIRGNGRPRETVSEFRQILRKCKLQPGQRFFNDCTQDSGDFLAWLLSRFPVDKGVVRVETFYTNSEGDTTDDLHLSTTVERSQGPVIDVARSLLISKIQIYGDKPVPINSFVTWSDDSGTMLNDDGLGSIKASEGDIAGQRFSRRITQNKILTGPGAMIFSIMRGGADDFGNVQKVLRNPVVPTPEIVLESGQHFRFSAVSVHHSNHYWCYYRHDNVWYLYDDANQQTPKLIGSYKTLIKTHGILMSHGTVFYYNQVSGVRKLN